MAEDNTIYLIDISGLVHRAFYAIRPLSNSSGLPTNALYGLARMLRKFSRDTNPEYCVAVFDAGRETFRNEMFADYKANRPPAPEELVSQFPYARTLVEAMGYPAMEVPGFEADDVIATIADRALADGFKVVVESGDKDLLQLVGDRVEVHDPMKDKTYDNVAVADKMGVPPELVIDLLALMGDSSDNVPGVRGIGKKGAAELIGRYGRLEDVFEHLDELTPGRREALLVGRDYAFMSRDLVTLRRDVPIDKSPSEMVLREDVGHELVDLLTELGFQSMLVEVVTENGPAAVKSEISVEEVGSEEGFSNAIDKIEACPSPSVAALMTDRNPVEPDCKGLAVALSPTEALVFRPGSLDDGSMSRLATCLSDKADETTIADYKEVFQVFAAVGASIEPPALDPVLAQYVLHPERESTSLETLSIEELGEPLPQKSAFGAEEIGRRAIAALRVSERLKERLREVSLHGLLRDVEVPLARVLAEMEISGVTVDGEALLSMSAEFGRGLQGLEAKIIKAAGVPFNPNSPKQLAEILFDRLELKVIKKTKTGRSTNVKVLEKLSGLYPDVKIPSMILEYRELAKLKSTYADALAALMNRETGRIHTSYNQTVTATGRLSSSNPNLQNIPVRTETGRRIRGAFVCQSGYVFVSADYSQIELRVLAHMSDDESLVDAFKLGKDIHSRTASMVYGCEEAAVTAEMRRTAKVINFGLLYGMGAFRLSGDLGISMAEAKRFIDDYFSAFPRVRGFLDSTMEFAKEKGYVETLYGRRREIEGILSKNRNTQAAAERMAVNTPIQGTAAEIIKVAMVRLRERLIREKLDARIVMQVHDELVLEANETQADKVAEVLGDEMRGACRLSVPLEAEIEQGRTWSELH